MLGRCRRRSSRKVRQGRAALWAGGSARVSADLPGGAVQRGDQGAQDGAAERPVCRLLPGILRVQSLLRLQRLRDCALRHHPVDEHGLRDGQGRRVATPHAAWRPPVGVLFVDTALISDRVWEP